MAQLDPNQYKAVWKHKTPLNSDYLNILLEGQEPGLVSLPTITPSTSSVTVGSFSAFVQPVDGSENYLPNEIMKVVVTQDTVVTVIRDTNGTAKTRGIGLKVVKTETETRISIDAVDAADCATYKGIFIASVLYPYNTSSCWATVNGADYSDILLTKLGYDPSFWAAPVSPRRNVGYDANVNNLISLWELRFHNNIYSAASGATPSDNAYTPFSTVPVINMRGDINFVYNCDTNTNLYIQLHNIDIDNDTPIYFIGLTYTYNRSNPTKFTFGVTGIRRFEDDVSASFIGHNDGHENFITPTLKYLATINNINNYLATIKPVLMFTGIQVNVVNNELRVE